ncbi:MAG: hypothetical protein GC145_06265 [Caulobacter sp.]|nr:hypothetical protein [Caulobacter sp.]
MSSNALELVFPIAGGGAGLTRYVAFAASVAVGGPGVYLQAFAAIYGPLFAPDIPKPEGFQSPILQPFTPRHSAYGRNRLSGPWMLYESIKGKAFDVIACHSGQVEAIEDVWLNDDVVTLSGTNFATPGDGGRFGNGKIRILTRTGLPRETSYVGDVTDFSGLPTGTWTSDHRGDGIASICVIQQAVEQADMPKTYISGLYKGAVTARCLMVHDWRDEAQDPDDPQSWTCSFNNIVQLRDYLTNRDATYDTPPAHVAAWGATYQRFGHGMGLDPARIEAAIDDWTDAADDCDDAIALKAGGTEPRYQSHGVFQHTTAPSEVIGRMLESCDGWLTQRGDGALTVRAGVYSEPEVTFGDDHVINYDVEFGVRDEDRIDGLIVSFTSPEHQFKEVETDAWGDVTADRLGNASFPWVQNNGQARRLAKRRFARQAAALRGTVVTNLYGMRGLCERYIRLQISDLPELNDIVVEIVAPVRFDPAVRQLTYSWIAADPNVDTWNPTTEEGDGPATEDRVPGEDLTAPTIDDVTPFFEAAGTAGDGVRLTVEATGPDRADLTWFVGWRVKTVGVSWNEASYSDIDPEAAVVLQTGFVTADVVIEVRAAYSTGSGDLSDWSDVFEVDTSTANVAPASPTSLDASPDGSPVEALVTWRNPTSSNFDHARVWRAADPGAFGTATDVSGALPGSAGGLMSFSDAPGAGTWRYWVTAENASDTASSPAGPDTVTI